VVFDPQGWMLKTLDFHKPLDEWIAQLESAPEPAAKLDAIRALGALGGGMARGDAEAALGRVLHSNAFHGLRRAAAEALGALGTEAALHELQTGPATSIADIAEPDSRVRTGVLSAFKKFPKHKELIPILGRALEADRSFAARAAAAGALGAFRTERKEVAPLLVRALTQKSPRDLVLAVSLTALAELDAPQTIEEAERYARYGAPDGARGRAMLALARYTARQKDAKMKEDVRLVLESYLDDPVYRIRREVYSALAALGDPAAIPALERSARNEVDGEQRGKAESALRALRTAKGGGDAVAGDLAGRVEQLERESDVLKARIEELEGKH
jgi:aminopeptidase N